MKSSAVLLAVLAVLGVSTLTQAQTTTSDEHNQAPTYSVNIGQPHDACREIRAPQRLHKD